MPARRGEAWNDEDIATLRWMSLDGAGPVAIAKALQRTPSAVQAKLRQMRLVVHARSISGLR